MRLSAIRPPRPFTATNAKCQDPILVLAAEIGRQASARAEARGIPLLCIISLLFQHGDVAALKVPGGLLTTCRLLPLFSIKHVDNITQSIPRGFCTSPQIPETPAQPCRSESLGICQSLRPQSHVCNLLLSISQCCQTTLRACFLPTLCQRCYKNIGYWLQAVISELPVLPQDDTRE